MLEQKLKSLAELQKELEENEAWREAKFEKVKALPEYQEFEKLRQERSDIGYFRGACENSGRQAPGRVGSG